MNPQEMLNELNENYRVLKAQFQKADLSQIPPLKLAELMYKHLAAMQKVIKMMADQQQTPPPKSPQPSRDRQGADNSASPTPPVTTASPTPPAKAQNSPPPPANSPKLQIDPMEYFRERLREHPELVPPALAKKLDISRAPPR